jgi:hypothetical protein
MPTSRGWQRRRKEQPARQESVESILEVENCM